MLLLNNAIDTGKFSYSHDTRIRIRKELNISEEQLVIGHVGRFCPQKNHAFIIDVFSKFAQSCLTADLF